MPSDCVSFFSIFRRVNESFPFSLFLLLFFLVLQLLVHRVLRTVLFLLYRAVMDETDLALSGRRHNEGIAHSCHLLDGWVLQVRL
jgi:hypothetical protein